MPDNLKIGSMDQWLTAQSKVETKDAKGKVTQTWTNAFNFFASASAVKSQENFSALATVAPETVMFTTHARNDLNRALRIKDVDSNYWEIILVRRISGNMYMEIECQRLND